MSVPARVMRESRTSRKHLLLTRHRALLKKQDHRQCVAHHRELIRQWIDPGKRLDWVQVSWAVPTKALFKQWLQQGPLLVTANGSARKESKYIGHHALVAVDFADEDTVLLLDCDDTIAGEDSFLYEVSIDEFLSKLSPPTNEDFDGEERQVDGVLERLDATWWTTIRDLWRGKPESE
jgi:hypothetical protein